MNKVVKFPSLCALLVAAAGCSLESPIQFGMDCDMAYIESEKLEMECGPGDCQEYGIFFEAKQCPMDAQYCARDKGGRLYCSSQRQECHATMIQIANGEMFYPNQDSKYEFHLKHQFCPPDASYCWGTGDEQFCSSSMAYCDAEYVQLSNGERYRLDDDNIDSVFKLYLSNHACPVNAPYCSATSEGISYCSEDNCQYNYRLKDGNCVPIDYSRKCEDVSLIQKGDKSIYHGDNALYDKYIDNNACPDEAPDCMKILKDSSDTVSMPEVHFCSDNAASCPAGTHLYGSDCERNSAIHCGDHENNCLTGDGVYRAECEDAKCKVTSCLDGFVVVENACLSADQCCGMNCINCKETENTKICSGNGECVGDCPDTNEIKCGGSCVNPMTSSTYCGASSMCELNVCGTNAKCTSGHCECISGYKLCDETCISMSSIEHCGECENDCTQLDGWKDGSCNSGICKISQCKNGYHIAIGEQNLSICEQDTPEICGDGLVDCTKIQNVIDSKCVAGKCEILACAEGYHVYANTCEQDDEDHCGEQRVTCNAPINGTAACVGGQCKYGCKKDYIMNGDICVLNSAYCTNENAERCVESGESGYGIIQMCIGGEWTEQGECFGGNSCNSDGSTCGACKNGAKQCNGRIPQTCSGGVWSSSTECAADKICSGGDCVSYSVNNCGGHGVGCNPSVIANGQMFSCNSGVCTVEKCQDGFYVYNNTCVANSTENCGAYGNDCNILIPHSTGTECTNSECVATSCDISGTVRYMLYNGKCYMSIVRSCSIDGKSYVCFQDGTECSGGTGCVPIDTLTHCSNNSLFYCFSASFCNEPEYYSDGCVVYW